MLGGKNFSFESAAISDAVALEEFVLRYYKSDSDIPDEIICGEEIESADLLEKYFRENFAKRVSILCVKQGVRKQLADMAGVNDQEHLENAVDKIKHKNDMTVTACALLKEKLALNNYPKRMECYDISNISGVDKVGSMVVFSDGEPDRDSYRRFKIKSFEGADDYRAHQEMMTRRLERLSTDYEKFPKPDLIIIDGGKGQLSSAREIILEKGMDVAIVGLAKREELIFRPNESEPIVLSHKIAPLMMLQRLRDEAHRYAITYHRKLRSKNISASSLDDIAGIGKKRKMNLLKEFGTIDNIKKASIEELAKTEGMNLKTAENVYNYYH
jgi:excinuclease ABC subunit C